MILHQTFADFVLFLYVHISQADNTYDPKELAIIKAKMGKLFPEGTDLEKKLYSTIKQYNLFDKSKLNELFESSLRHFGNESASKSGLYSDLYEIIQADGKIHQSETSSLEVLKNIIDGREG